MSVLLLANGELEPGSWLEPYLAEAAVVVAVDGGLAHLERLGIRPDLLIGDLDSADEQALAALRQNGCEVSPFPTEKDETDLELALLEILARYDQPVHVAGAFGGRYDQQLANIMLLTHEKVRDRPVTLIARHQRLWLITAQGTIRGEVGDTVSLIPLAGDVKVGRTEGLKWSLTNEWLRFGPARGVSNMMTAPAAQVEIEQGLLLCVHIDGVWRR